MGIIRSAHIFEDLFKSSHIRTGNYFCNIVGIAEEQSYNDLLALINHKFKNTAYQSLLFTDSIPKPNDRDLISSILSELASMTVGNFVNEEINLTDSEALNYAVKTALDTVVTLASQNERFSNQTIQNNFIAKLLIWVNTYLETTNMSGSEVPKCLFYGQLKPHEGYFLMLLALIGFDVVYFNPSDDKTLERIDKNNLCDLLTLGEPGDLLSFEKRAQKGVVIDKVTTYAKQASTQLDETLYLDSGIYRPWQFAQGFTRPLLLDAIIEDTLTYWDEPARLRPGFRVSAQDVYTPVFLNKISGVYHNINDYYDLVDKLKQAKRSLFFEKPHLGSLHYNQKDLYSLAFCLMPDGTIKADTLKEHTLYKKMLTFRAELQSFILNKIEETLSSANYSFFNFPITNKERIKLMAAIFTAEDSLLNLIDSYDFTSHIPKVIFYLNSRDVFSVDDSLLLALLHKIGLDIVILSPNGANNIEMTLCDKFITSIKLDEFAYDLPLKSAPKKTSLFNKLFSKGV
jgi:hypothetical protein